MKHAGWQSWVSKGHLTDSWYFTHPLPSIWYIRHVSHIVIHVSENHNVVLFHLNSTYPLIFRQDEIGFFIFFCYLGIGGNLVSIQSSRISTRLHLNYLPREVPADRRKCYNPCSIFFGSGKTHRHTHKHIPSSNTAFCDRTKSSIGSDSAPPGDPWPVDFFIFFTPDEGSQNNAKFSLDSCLLGCLCNSGEWTPLTLRNKKAPKSTKTKQKQTKKYHHTWLFMSDGYCSP